MRAVFWSSCPNRSHKHFVPFADAYLDATTALFPSSRAEWIALAGWYAMFDGPSLLGMFAPATAEALTRIETLLQEKVHHEASPSSDPSLFPLLDEHG